MVTCANIKCRTETIYAMQWCFLAQKYIVAKVNGDLSSQSRSSQSRSSQPRPHLNHVHISIMFSTRFIPIMFTCNRNKGKDLIKQLYSQVSSSLIYVGNGFHCLRVSLFTCFNFLPAGLLLHFPGPCRMPLCISRSWHSTVSK